MSDGQKNLVEVKGLKTHFPIKAGVLSRTVGQVKAVDGVSFKIEAGKTLGLVGESGCGKTTVGRTLIRLIQPTEGSFTFDGEDVFSLPAKAMKKFRRTTQMMFQDPYGSLNPRMIVEAIIGEAMVVHRVGSKKQRQDRVAELMDKVGLSSAHLNRYPHEFSGGQRQRIGIARALALDPKFIICDEPVSALDVSIQSQIVNLMQDLQEQLNLTYLFIAHDLAVVEHISDFVAVMYLGRIVEYADRDTLYANPVHPYTQALLSAIPEPMPNKDKQRIVLGGEVPSPSNPPPGCPFHLLCCTGRFIAEELFLNETHNTEMLDIRTENGVFIVSFKQASIGGIGEVEKIAETLRELIKDQNICNMVVDFSTVSFFSSQMLGLLVDIWRRIKDKGGTLLISGINPQLTRVFRITHLDKLFDFHETMEAAVSSLHTS